MAGFRKFASKGGDPHSAPCHEGLLVFGYPCTIFRDDSRTADVDQLIKLSFDPETTIDRYDCRLLFTSISELTPPDPNRPRLSLTLEEQEIEHLCDIERYRDLKELEDSAKTAKAAIPFDYDATEESLPDRNGNFEDNQSASSSSNSEDESFAPPPELRVPSDLILPTSHVQNAVIEKTALFVCEKGPQMEIVINAKQKSNKQFRFLDFENPLHKYYRHVLKMVREKKYTPNFDSVPVKKAKKPVKGETSENDDSDSDDGGSYLHPSLLARRQNPKTPGISTLPISIASVKPISTYKLGEENDIYSELYNRLSMHLPKKTASEPNLEEKDQLEQQQRAAAAAVWNADPSVGANAVVVPPPPDVQPIVDRLAEYVARNGPDFEQMVRAGGDPRFAFLDPRDFYWPYYVARLQRHRYDQYVAAYYGVGLLAASAAAGQPWTTDDSAAFRSQEGAAVASKDETLGAEKVDSAINEQQADKANIESAVDINSSDVKKSASLNDLKPYEKTDGVTISFCLKPKDKQQIDQSQTGTFELPCDDVILGDDSALVDPDQTSASKIVHFELPDDSHPLDETLAGLEKIASNEQEESLKNERRKKARLFLNLLKKPVVVKNDVLEDSKSKDSANQNQPAENSTNQQTVVESDQQKPKIKRRRFDVMHRV